MKKILKWIPVGVIAISPTIALVSCSTLDDQLNINKKEYVDYALTTKDDDLSLTSLAYSSGYDTAALPLKHPTSDPENYINIYHTEAMYPWRYMYHHAILSRAKSYIFRIKNSELWDFESYFSKTAFEEYKTKQMSADNLPNNFTHGSKKGILEDIDWKGRYMEKGDIEKFAVKTIKLIKENKKKKINIFLNSLQAHTSPGNPKNYYGLMGKSLLEIFTSFPNVRVHLIPDGSGTSALFLGMDSKTERFKQMESMVNIAKEKLGHVFFYTSKPNDAIKKFGFDKTGNEKYKNIFQELKFQKIQDLAFNQRAFISDTNKASRIFHQLSTISGFNYKTSLEILKKVVAATGKKNLIVLGSYVDPNEYYNFETRALKDIISKYGAKYNIFYKGHPGHNDMAANIEKTINNNEANPIKQKAVILPAFIPSEELTNKNVQAGMKFEKFISMGTTSALNSTLQNGYNHKEDILGYYNVPDAKNKLGWNDPIDNYFVPGLWGNIHE